MSHDQILKKMIAGALLSGGVAVAGLGLATGTAQADDWYGPHQWCPGQTMNGPTGPGPNVVWNMGVCHTWYHTAYGQGNVADKYGSQPGPNVWDGDNPPPSPAHNPLCLPGPGCAPWP